MKAVLPSTVKGPLADHTRATRSLFHVIHLFAECQQHRAASFTYQGCCTIVTKHYKVWACPIAALGRLAVVHSVPHRPMDRYAPHSGQLWGSHGWQALGLHSLARKHVPRVRLSP